MFATQSAKKFKYRLNLKRIMMNLGSFYWIYWSFFCLKKKHCLIKISNNKKENKFLLLLVIIITVPKVL